MKTEKLSSSAPWLFYSIVCAGLLFLFSLWFFLHPNSPWHSRNHYSIAFKEIGSLKEGSAVNVGGLKRGYVEELDLTDSCVWVKIALLSEIKIPVDSKMRLVNVGLMGQRAVEIERGEAEKYYANNSSIIGFFEMGSTSIGVFTVEILQDAASMMEILSGVADSLFSDERKADYKRLGKKGNALGNNISRIANNSGNSLEALLDSLSLAKDKTDEMIAGMKTDFSSAAENMDLAMKNIGGLGKSIGNLKTSIESIANELENGDNTVSLLLSNEQKNSLKKEMKKLSGDAENLMDKINRRGLDLNADIF